jgi:hypothetical protein
MAQVFSCALERQLAIYANIMVQNKKKDIEEHVRKQDVKLEKL